ncbi:MAG TPA: S8 family serine peptidase [Burkholderiales bacterium]|nr:S8 family serine peptidase [Burkholderiales bacterium]
MKVRFLLILAGAFLSAAGCSPLGTIPTASPPPAAAPGRQVLLMLRESATRHYRPGAIPLAAYANGSASSKQLKTARELAGEYDLRLLANWPMPSIGVRCFLAGVGPGRVVGEVASRLANDPRVESSQPVQVFHALGHGDPYYALQSNATLLQLDQLHRMATGKNVRVAQVDTGVDLHHPDLEGQLSDARNFVDGTEYVAEIHGTAVAGIVVAKADNGVGIVGVAPGAVLMPLRACWQGPEGTAAAMCTSFTLAKAIQYALTNEARVLNLSVAGPQDRLLERLIDKAIEQDVTVVGALDPAAPDDSFPANHPNVIAVASVGIPHAHLRAILAPGDHVLTTMPNASWGYVSGSSFAAAQVTGVAALLLEKSPRLKPGDVSSLLHEHERQTDPAGETPNFDACAALASVSGRGDCHCCGTAASRHARQQVDGVPPH